jgi:hypothetical protein
MRFRPANIRLINRRSNMLRLLLALSSRNSKSNRNDKNNPTDSQGWTGSLHIRDLPIKGTWPVVIAILVGGLIATIHAYWIKGIGDANATDRKVAEVFEGSDVHFNQYVPRS